jgi:nucleotidyltransferase/DNA polymerase involved in DNA repair
LKLQDIYGIGPRMERRLNRAGVFTVTDLWQASSLQLRQIWGGINGVLFHQLLHGADLQPPSSPFAHSLGHQHVLEPKLRTPEGARQFAQHLLAKAAERLRHRDYYCRRLGLHLRRMGDLGGWWNECPSVQVQAITDKADTLSPAPPQADGGKLRQAFSVELEQNGTDWREKVSVS